MEHEESDLTSLEEPTEPPGDGDSASAPVFMPGVSSATARVAERDEETSALIDMTFLGEFFAMMKDAHAHRRLVDIRAETSKGASDFAILTLEHGVGAPLDETFKSFYRTTNGLEFAWNYTDDSGAVRPGGEVRLVDFGEVLGLWVDTLWQCDPEEPEPLQELRWALRGFDCPRRHDTAHIVALSVLEEGGLFLWDGPGQPVERLHLSVFEYLGAAMDLMGVYGWQRMFTRPYDEQPVEEQRRIDERFTLLDSLGLGHDLDYYRWMVRNVGRR